MTRHGMPAAGSAGGGDASARSRRTETQHDYDVFISYAHEDGKGAAAGLEDGLIKRGLRVWRDETSISIGDPMAGKIRDGLGRSSHMVAVVSPAYLESAWARMELGGMLLGSHGGRILPVLRGICHGKASGSLPALANTLMGSWDGDPEQLMDDIARAVGGAGAGPHPKGLPPEGRPAGAAAAGDDAASRKMRDAMERHSRGTLVSVPSGIGGLVIPRQEAGDIMSLLERCDRIVLTGDKGSGKSVILCQLYERLAAEGRRALLVRCDDLLCMDSSGGPDGMLGGGTSILDFIEGERGGPGTVFLFDSLDAVSRDGRSMSAFRRFLRRLWAVDGAKTVCSVRTYDYEHSPAISRDQWGCEVRVGDLGEDVLEDALMRMGNPSVPDGLRGILRNPLRLKLLHMIVEKNPGADFSGVESEVRLYREHWREYVDKQEIPNAAARILLDMAKAMVESRRTTVPANSLGCPAAGLETLRSRGIVLESRGQLLFFHHAYLDYVASMHVLRDYPSIQDFLERDEYNVFFRPALASALSMLRDRSRGEYLKAILSICRSGLKHYWKISALDSLAAADGFTKGEMEPIGRLLTKDPVLQRHFLAGAARARNPFWFRLWSETVMGEWAASGPNAEPVADYIRSLLGHRDQHGEMIRLVSLLVSNGKTRPAACEKIVAMTAGMSAPGRAAWRLTLN